MLAQVLGPGSALFSLLGAVRAEASSETTGSSGCHQPAAERLKLQVSSDTWEGGGLSTPAPLHPGQGPGLSREEILRLTSPPSQSLGRSRKQRMGRWTLG